MKVDKVDDPKHELPVALKRISVFFSLVLVVLAALVGSNELAGGKLVALLLLITAAPPIATMMVLEIANYVFWR